MSPRAGIVAVAIAVVGATSVLGPQAAHAEDEEPAEPAPAPAATDAESDGDTLIRRGLELRLVQRDREALVELQKAYDLTGSPRALALVALTEQALGAWRTADTHLRAAVTVESDPWIQKNRQALEQALANIGAHLAAPPEIPSLRIVQAGPDAELAAGAAARERAHPFRIAGGAASALGVALLSAGIVSSINVGTDSHANEAGDVFSPDREDSGKRAQTMQWIFYGTGVAALGAGAALLLYAHRLRAPDQTARLAPTLVPFVTAAGDGGGLTLTVRR